jgi:hypothetical protein
MNLSTFQSVLLLWVATVGATLNSTPSNPTGQKIPELAPLLTPGYGIVDEKERREQAGKGGLVWLCLKLEKISMKCEENGEDTDVPSPRSKLVFDILQVSSGNSIYEFNLRQVTDEENCKLTHRRWKKILTGQEVACFSAYPYESVEETNKGKHLFSWVELDRIKSRKGEWTFFVQHKPSG